MSTSVEQLNHTTTCYAHPHRETGLKCYKCGQPMCVDCSRHMIVGVWCKKCIYVQRGIPEYLHWTWEVYTQSVELAANIGRKIETAVNAAFDAAAPLLMPILRVLFILTSVVFITIRLFISILWLLWCIFWTVFNVYALVTAIQNLFREDSNRNLASTSQSVYEALDAINSILEMFVDLFRWEKDKQ